MLSNFSRIFVKYSLFLFIFLSAIQDIFCMDDEMTGLFAKSPSIAGTKKDKENSREVENIRLDIRVAEWSSSRRGFQGANQRRLVESRCDGPQDVGGPIVGSEAEAGISIKKKRPRPGFSSSQAEESSEDPVPESKSLTLFDVLGEREAYEVQILNAALYKKSEVLRMDVDLGAFTPTKINAYREAGGTTPELKTKIDVLKTLYSKEIKDIEHFPRQHDSVFSPAVRNLPRETVGELRSLGLVFHLPDFATREPIMAETGEERTLRKERQKEEFEALEKKLGNSPKQLTDELEIALEPWKLYFKYVELTKERYLESQMNKLKWPDLVGVFLKYVAPYMECLEIEGYEVYFTLKTLKFNRICSKHTMPNHELMEDGLCPVGPDGESMNWHHVTRIDVHSHKVKVDEATKQNHEGPYKLVLIPASIHTKYDALLHPEHYVSPRNEINRSAFGTSREVINKKIRELFYVEK